MKKDYKIYDSFSMAVPNTDNLKNEFKIIKDSVDIDEKYLEIEVDVTHGGYINKNFYYYEPDGQAMGASSFFDPYPTPVINEHITSGKPIGRTWAAAFIPLPVDPKDKNNLKVPKSKIRVRSVITDKDAIDDILSRRSLTVSTGGAPQKPPICNVCTQDATECEHTRGRVYDNKTAYWKIGPVRYQEYSFVNLPADQGNKHVANIVSMRFVGKDALDVGNTVSLDKIHDDKGTTDSIYIEDKIGGQDMDKELKQILESALDILDNYEDGDDADIQCDKWENEKEVSELIALDAEYCKFMCDTAEDKTLTPESKKGLSESSFCGPNRTFPVTDCKHARTALAYVAFPRVKAKYSDSTIAKIKACVRRKAKNLGCPIKSKDSVEAKPNTKVTPEVTMEQLTADNKSLKSDITKLNEQVASITVKLQATEVSSKTATDQLIESKTKIKKVLAKRYIDLLLINKKENVKDVVIETDTEKRKTMYNEKIEEFIKLEDKILEDDIEKLETNFCASIQDFVKIDSPVVIDSKNKAVIKENISDKEVKEDKILSRVFRLDKLKDK